MFLGYAFVPYLPVLFALFVLDNIFFGFNLAVESYFQKIAHSPQEITSNVSMAQTINHISALIVPVLGGILWEQISPSATFWPAWSSPSSRWCWSSSSGPAPVPAMPVPVAAD